MGGEHNLVCSRIMYSLIFFFFTFKSRGVESRNRRIYREQTFDTAEGEMVGLIMQATKLPVREVMSALVLKEDLSET